MKIELNIHHTCHSAAEFTAISERIAALLAEFAQNSAGPLRPSVATDPVLHTVATTPVPPAPVARSEPAAPAGVDGSAEANVPAAFAAALAPDDKPKRVRRTKEQIAADETAKAAAVALPAPVATPIPAPAPVVLPSAPSVDIFAPAPAVTAAPVAPAVETPTPSVPAARPAVDRTVLRPLMMQVFDLENGEAVIARILAPFGGSVAKVPEDKIGAVAVELNAAIRGQS